MESFNRKGRQGRKGNRALAGKAKIAEIGKSKTCHGDTEARRKAKMIIGSSDHPIAKTAKDRRKWKTRFSDPSGLALRISAEGSRFAHAFKSPQFGFLAISAILAIPRWPDLQIPAIPAILPHLFPKLPASGIISV